MLAFWRFITIVLSALALTMTSAHVLELPQKMAYSPEMYAAVNTTLYRYFAIIGGFYQIGSIASAIVLTTLVRRFGSFRWTLAGTLLLIAAFVSWLILVLPVNREVAAALEQSPQAIPALWLQLRDRWEYGHATGFVLHLAGFCALVIATFRQVPPQRDPARHKS